ncbi:MAG: class I SAM-dependent methyltransferase [Cytophagaceae bacterium]
MPISNKIEWISSEDSRNESILMDLQKKMEDFYANSKTYYKDIDFTKNVWINPSALIQKDIIRELQGNKRILEVGCGSANILMANAIDESEYSGVEFSSELINLNKSKFPKATFKVIEDPRIIPFEENLFDVVFSTYVLEHTVFPGNFLKECMRVLKPGGVLIVVCPDFLGKGRMSSQRCGLSQGTGKEKFMMGKIFDAFITGFDSKVRVPITALILRRKAIKKPQFYININPICFEDKFRPDVDAIYVTYDHEIKSFLKSIGIICKELDKDLLEYSHLHRNIYIKGIKIGG